MAKNIAKIVLIVLIIGLLAFVAVNGLSLTAVGIPVEIHSVMDEEHGIRKGFDLTGGSVIVYEADAETVTTEQSDTIRDIMRKRLDRLGFTEATVAKQGEKRVVIEIPSVTNPDEAIKTLGKTAKLHFVDSDGVEILTGDHRHFSQAYLWIQFAVCIVFLADFFIRLARSERRTRFFLRNLLFLLLSIPYLNLVDWFSLELARGWAMLIGLTPLLRGFLALYIIVAWLARNRFNQLLAAYLFSVLVFTYLASLVFYDYEILVNPRLADYGDALWWAWMNVTTVGAAIFPVTAVGKVVCVLLPIVGMIFFPIFTVYISQYYTGKKSSN